MICVEITDDMHPFSGVSRSAVHTITVTGRGLKYPRRAVDLSRRTGISALFTLIPLRYLPSPGAIEGFIWYENFMSRTI